MSGVVEERRFERAYNRRRTVMRELAHLFRQYSRHDYHDARHVALQLLRFQGVSEEEYDEIMGALIPPGRFRFLPTPQEKPESWTDPAPDDAA